MDDLTSFSLVCLTITGFIILLSLAVRRQTRIWQAIQARLKEVEGREQALLTLNTLDMRYQVDTLNKEMGRRENCVLIVSPRDVILFQRRETLPEVARFSHTQVRWFGRPQKYSPGRNEIWLHLESESAWKLLKIWLGQDSMRALVRTLKQVAAPELVTAYRRQRPYIHSGPHKVKPATQDIHGAWTLGDAFDLYLMPRFLVILEGSTVLRKIPLEAVQQIGALRRIDQPKADGLVRFRAEEEPFAFSLLAYEAFAAALAEAAKRTLEMPLEQKQKDKEAYDEDE